MLSRTAAALVSTLACLLLIVPSAEAAFPGRNGKIAFLGYGDSGTGIYTINPDGSGVRFIAAAGVNPRYGPAWSPDGKKLAFTRDEGTGSTIVVVDADGGGEVTVTHNGFSPAWSPDGKKLVFTGEDGLHVINTDGTGDTQLTTNDRDHFDFDPAWSPDGDRIAFVSYLTTYPCQCKSPPEIPYLIDPDGSHRAPLTDPSRGGNAREPDWSPDGTKIALWWADYYYTPSLSVVPLDGSPETFLTAGYSPAWSPDGTKIVYPGAVFGGQPPRYLETISPDGSGITLLNRAGAYPDWQPLPFKNGSDKCKAFPGGYRNHGQCVRASR
jgi:Tol biopolymer transport system component